MALNIAISISLPLLEAKISFSLQKSIFFVIQKKIKNESIKKGDKGLADKTESNPHRK